MTRGNYTSNFIPDTSVFYYVVKKKGSAIFSQNLFLLL